MAADMSRTEDYDQVHEERDGYMVYTGKCSLHQDHEGVYFTVGKTIVETYEPAWRADPADTMKVLRHVEKELLAAAAVGSDQSVEEFFAGVDDFTLEKIKSKPFAHLDLYRFNIGVGGGNGYYDVYKRSVVNGKISYEQMSKVFDGEVEICDEQVWLK